MHKLESPLTNLNLGGVDSQVGHTSPTQPVGLLEPQATPVTIVPPAYTSAYSDDALRTSPQLPPEIVMNIMSFVHRGDQIVLANACKVSRAWYQAAVGFL